MNRAIVYLHQATIKAAGEGVRWTLTINLESGCYRGGPLSAYVYPTGEVVQLRGAVHWRVHVRRYQAVAGVLLPHETDGVAHVIRHHRLDTTEDYLAWLELELEQARAPMLPPWLERAHRAIYARALDRLPPDGPTP